MVEPSHVQSEEFILQTNLKPKEEKFYASTKILNDSYINVEILVVIHAD